MSRKEMTSLERVLAAMGHQEPDQVPLFLMLSLYGAKERQMPVREYFSRPEQVAATQLKMREKYRNDCLYTFFYAPIEIEAMGGEVIFTDCGPPNSGEPLIKSPRNIKSITMPEAKRSRCLARVLEVTRRLRVEAGNIAPIIGVVMAPFSLPVMQMGFDRYLELLYFDKSSFDLLMQKNSAFCVDWANAQLAAGATAICYFNPLASPNMIERETYLKTGYPVDRATLGKINGPTATHLASGITLPVLNDIADTGTLVLGFSAQDDLSEIKKAARGKICLLGNLNALEMVHWDKSKVEQKVQNVIEKAAQGGGLILSDNHGEIPWQVPEEVLLEISGAVRRYGCYYSGDKGI